MTEPRQQPPPVPPLGSQLYDSPVECALRLLYLLCESAPDGCDLQRLVIYDYMLVHSSDVGGPPSLHPASPFRSGELLVRRGTLSAGLRLLQRKGLVEQTFGLDGIRFRRKESAVAFLRYLESAYARNCAEIARWIGSTFSDQSAEQLQTFADQNLGRWGAEFSYEALFAGDWE
jgi:hypothetical protein